MSGLSSTLSSLAKRSIPITSVFNDLVRGIGESKSKDEEDSIVAKMVELCRTAVKSGRRDPRSSKEFLLYLVYIDMLGHDTRWAHASVIQLCSDKSLVVKKAAYLAASLLLPPESELHIMLTATIQADFKSDNWVVVATALTATNRVASAELAAVFVPAVIGLTSHASQAVARRALLTLRRLLQLDPDSSPDIERVLVERLGHREPALMAAALCALRELITTRPPQYAGLARYLVAILKQAYEGKLGRAFEVHKAPAPFIQVELLRLLRRLGTASPSAAAEAAVVVAEAQRRAEALGSGLGAAVALEALRTRAALNPSPGATADIADAATRLLSSGDPNSRYAGIDALSRLVDSAPDRVAGAQLMLLDALRGGDATLARATLGLLFRVAGPANVSLIAQEVLAYLRSPAAAGSGPAARRAVASELLAIAERCAPSTYWYASTAAETLAAAGEDAAPEGAGDTLADVVVEYCSSSTSSVEERRAVVDSVIAWLDPPSRAAAVARTDDTEKEDAKDEQTTSTALVNHHHHRPPTQLLAAAAWVAGECGHLSSRGTEGAVDALCTLRESHAPDPRILACAAGALGKLAARAGGSSGAAREARDFLEHASRSAHLELQQRAVHSLALLKEPEGVQRAVWLGEKKEVVLASATDGNLLLPPSVDAIVERALASGAAPYLSKTERADLGLGPQGLDGLYPLQGVTSTNAVTSTPLHFEAYERNEAPISALVLPPAVDIRDQTGAVESSSSTATTTAAATGGMIQGSSRSAAAPQLLVGRAGQARKWGPQAASSVMASTAAGEGNKPFKGQARSSSIAASFASTSSAAREPVVDPAKQKLAASLFGGSSSNAVSTGVSRRKAAQGAAKDLLGGLEEDDTGTTGVERSKEHASSSALEDLLSLGFETAVPASFTSSVAVQDPMANFLELGAADEQSPAQERSTAVDPFASPVAAASPAAPAAIDPFATAALHPTGNGGSTTPVHFFSSNGGMGANKVLGAQKSPPPSAKKADPFADLLG